MNKPNRKLCKSLIVRLKPEEKQLLEWYTIQNNISTQDLLRAYILQLTSDKNILESKSS